MDRIFSFDPVWRDDARVLILGTMPSVESLRAGFYYAHPRNCFWPLMADCLGAALPATLEDKVELLGAHRIALWDVARSCVREGSLDSAITKPLPSDIGALLAQCPGIHTILFNGGTAQRLFARLLPGVGDDLQKYAMPSTSPAYTLSYHKKREQWSKHILTTEG